MENKLPEGWEWKKLSDLTDFFYGGAFESSYFNEDGKGVKIIRIRNLKQGFTETYYDGEYDKSYLVQNGDILIGMDGEFNIVKWTGETALLNQRVCKIIVKSRDLLPDFAYRSLVKILKDIESRTAYVTVKHLSAKELNAIRIPLPPIETQQKIVSILEKAEETKKLRAQADELTQKLLQSVFLEMFGDPVENPKGWKISTLGDNLIEIKYGTSQPPNFSETGIEFVRATNIKNEEIITNDILFIDEQAASKIEKCKLKKGDIIIVRSGVNTGDCAVINEEHVDSYAAYDLIVTVDKNKLNPYFLSRFLNIPSTKIILKGLSRRAAQPHLNSNQINSIKLITPPIEMQNVYSDIVEQVRKTKENQQQSYLEINTLFDALMQKAFTGELVS